MNKKGVSASVVLIVIAALIVLAVISQMFIMRQKKELLPLIKAKTETKKSAESSLLPGARLFSPLSSQSSTQKTAALSGMLGPEPTSISVEEARNSGIIAPVTTENPEAASPETVASPSPNTSSFGSSHSAGRLTPSNPLPTDSQILASIAAQNREKEIVADLTAKKDAEIDSIRSAINTLPPSELMPDVPVTPSTGQQPPADILEKVRTKVYAVHH